MADFEPMKQDVAKTLETSNWSAGIYFLTIEKAGKQYTTKLIK